MLGSVLERHVDVTGAVSDSVLDAVYVYWVFIAQLGDEELGNKRKAEVVMKEEMEFQDAKYLHNVTI